MTLTARAGRQSEGLKAQKRAVGAIPHVDRSWVIAGLGLSALFLLDLGAEFFWDSDLMVGLGVVQSDSAVLFTPIGVSFGLLGLLLGLQACARDKTSLLSKFAASAYFLGVISLMFGLYHVISPSGEVTTLDTLMVVGLCLLVPPIVWRAIHLRLDSSRKMAIRDEHSATTRGRP